MKSRGADGAGFGSCNVALLFSFYLLFIFFLFFIFCRFCLFCFSFLVDTYFNKGCFGNRALVFESGRTSDVVVLVEGTNVITGHKCNKGHKCNNIWSQL